MQEPWECNFCPAPAEAQLGDLPICHFCLDLMEIKGLTYEEVLNYYGDDGYEEYPNT